MVYLGLTLPPTDRFSLGAQPTTARSNWFENIVQHLLLKHNRSNLLLALLDALSDAPEHHNLGDKELTAFRHVLVGFGRASRKSLGVAARYSLNKIARATTPSLHDS